MSFYMSCNIIDISKHAKLTHTHTHTHTHTNARIKLPFEHIEDFFISIFDNSDDEDNNKS